MSAELACRYSTLLRGCLIVFVSPLISTGIGLPYPRVNELLCDEMTPPSSFIFTALNSTFAVSIHHRSKGVLPHRLASVTRINPSSALDGASAPLLPASRLLRTALHGGKLSFKLLMSCRVSPFDAQEAHRLHLHLLTHDLILQRTTLLCDPAVWHSDGARNRGGPLIHGSQAIGLPITTARCKATARRAYPLHSHPRTPQPSNPRPPGGPDRFHLAPTLFIVYLLQLPPTQHVNGDEIGPISGEPGSSWPIATSHIIGSSSVHTHPSGAV
jgi:hypothetical protein